MNQTNTLNISRLIVPANKRNGRNGAATSGGVTTGGGNGSFVDISQLLKLVSESEQTVNSVVSFLKEITAKTIIEDGVKLCDKYVKHNTAETSGPQTIYGDLRIIGKIYSSDDIVAFSDGTGGGAAPTIPLATYTTTGVVKVDPTTMTVDANGMIAVKGDLFNLSNYYDKSASDARFAALGHVHAFSELTGKPTTIAEYGITDAVKNTGGTIAGDLTITGNLYLQQDGKYIVTEKVYSENDFITLRYNNPSLLAAMAYTGFEAQKVFADGSAGYLVFGNDGMARVGKMASLQMIATREDAPIDGAIQYYSAANKRLASGVLASDLWHKGNLNKDYLVSGNNAFASTVTYQSDINDIRISGFYSNYQGKNTPTGNLGENTYSIIHVGENAHSGAQIAVRHYGGITNEVYSRALLGDTYTGWAKMFSEVNLNRNDVDFTARNISLATQTIRSADGSVKWTIQLNASNALEYYNASGALVVRISQAGKIQAKDDIEAFSNFH
jgi:hypothetical protein